MGRIAARTGLENMCCLSMQQLLQCSFKVHMGLKYLHQYKVYETGY